MPKTTKSKATSILRDPGATRGRRNPRWPNINMQKACEAIGVSHAYLLSVLAGRYHASFPVAEKIAKVFEISLEEVGKLYNPQLAANYRKTQKGK